MNGFQIVTRFKLIKIGTLLAPFFLAFNFSCTRGPSLETCRTAGNLDPETKEHCEISYKDSEYLDNYNPYYVDNWLFGDEDLTTDEKLKNSDQIYLEHDSYRQSTF